MTWKDATDVLIVGAGPVGLMSGLVLARQHVDIHIIDEEWRPGAHAYCLALHPQSLALLEQVGVLEAACRRGRRVDAMVLYDGPRRAAKLHFDAVPARHPYLLVLPQNLVEDILLERLAHEGIAVSWEHHLAGLRLRDDMVIATIDELEKETVGYAVPHTDWVTERTRWMDARYVIGADGHRSHVRHTLDFEFPAAAEPEFYAIFEFECDHAPDDAAMVLSAGGRDVFWPLPGNRGRWSFQVNDQDIPHESRLKSRTFTHVGSQVYPYLTQDDLTRLIAERAPWFKHDVGEITWSLGVRFEHRLAERFGSGRIWLAGDAAHLAGPVGAHSLNVGLREAADLGAAIAVNLHEPPPHELLEERYDRPYHAEWEHLLGLAPTFAPDDHADAFIQQNAARLIECLPATGEDLMALAAQLHLHPATHSASLT